MSAIWIIVILVFVLFGPSAIAALVEKRMVWPYAPLGEKEITREGMNAGGNAAANAYIMRFIREATSEGFEYLECMRDAKGSKYKIIYHFLVSQDKYTLAIIGGGKILGLGVKGTWLYSKSNNEGCYYSVDNQSGLVTDISGFWRDQLLFDDNFAALYYTDTFHLSLKAAGIVAGTFGMMNLFARALGGIVSDRCSRRWGLRGRALLLGATIAAEGLAMMLFAQARWLPAAIGTMLLMGLFVKMSNGANYAVVPFVNSRALGAVAGIVGAGGNLGAVMAGFLFKTPSLTYSQGLMILGGVVATSSVFAFALRFTKRDTTQLAGELTAVAAAGAGD